MRWIADGKGLWFALGLVLMWLAIAAGLNTAQLGDNFEQFVWAHSVEWGYHKHPPLPTWMMAATIQAFGASPYWSYALSTACVAGTAVFTYWIADEIVGPQRRDLALLFWGLHNAFSVRVQLYNHNTVMMLWVSACVWAVLKALRSKTLLPWLCAGAAAGLAMLSKYQAAVALFGVLVALAFSGELAQASTRRGLGLAVLAALLLVAGHAAWVFDHGFTTLHYAMQNGNVLPWSGRAWTVASFLVQQVRLALPALLLLALLRWMQRRRPLQDLGPPESATARRRRHAWFIGLIAVPLGAVVAVGALAGLKLHGHWGFQSLQFAGLWFAWLAARNGSPVFRHLSLSTLAVHLVVAGVTILTMGSADKGAGDRDDVAYPARELAAAVQRDWSAVSSCPLELVVGPSFLAGMVSAYSAHPPRVLEDGDFAKSPWIQPEELERLGAVYVATSPADLPLRSLSIGSMPASRHGRNGAQQVHWAIVLPTPCQLSFNPPASHPAALP